MPISFPSSPATDDLYTYGLKTFRWTSTYWASIASEFTDFHPNKAAARTAIIAQGVSVPAEAPFADYAGYIDDIVGGDPLFAPDAFTSGQWTATAGDSEIVVNITALPADGGSAITALQYRLDGGTAVNFTGTGTGLRTISGLTNTTEYDVEIRAVNAIGDSAWSDVKSRTPASGGGGGALFLTATAQTGGSITVTRPTGATSADTICVILAGNNPAIASYAGPSGWTAGASVTNDEGSARLFTAPGDVAALAFTVTGLEVAAVWGVTAPLRAGSSLIESYYADTPGVDQPSPSITATAGDCVVSVFIHIGGSGTAPSGTPPSGYTSEVLRSTIPFVSIMSQESHPGGATGTISHGSTDQYATRIAFTGSFGS